MTTPDVEAEFYKVAADTLAFPNVSPRELFDLNVLPLEEPVDMSVKERN